MEPRSAARLLVGPGLDGNGTAVHATVADLPAPAAARRRGGGQRHPGAGGPAGPGQGHRGRGRGAAARAGRRTARASGRPWCAPAGGCPHRTLLYEPGRAGRRWSRWAGRSGDGPDGRRRVRLIDPVGGGASRDHAAPALHPPGARTIPERYQTVYAAHRELGERSAAAPTAGLHFTPELLEACRQAGATIARVDLAIGLDTFRPITAPTAEEHVIHSERYSVPAETMAACAAADRVVAVGTTVVRALESAAATGAAVRPDRPLHPRGVPVRVVDVLVTNFHLPRSSLLLLVEAFCGPVWRQLYATALAEGYRFLSFGDAMVVGRARPPRRARMRPIRVEVDRPATERPGPDWCTPPGGPTRSRPSCRWAPGGRSRPWTASTWSRWGPRWCWPTPTT